MSYLEQILTRKSNNNSNKDEFDLNTNYENELTKQAKAVYDKNKIFNSESVNDSRITPLNISRLSKRIRKLDEQAQGIDKKWFGMKKQEITPEMKDELNILKLRGYIKPDQFYKKIDWKSLPKYYQVGTVIGGGDEGKSMKIPKKEKKATLIDQFLAEDSATDWSKKKFKEIQAKKKNVTRKKLDRFKKLKKRGVVRA